MFSVKCLMLNCYGAEQLTTEQLSIAGFSREQLKIQHSKFNIALRALELRHGTARGARHNQFNHSQHIECYMFPVDLHTRSL